MKNISSVADNRFIFTNPNMNHHELQQTCPRKEEQIPFLDFSFFPVGTEMSALEKLDTELEEMHEFPYEEDDFGCSNPPPGLISMSKKESNQSETESSSFSTPSFPATTSSVGPCSLSQTPMVSPCMFPPPSTPGGVVDKPLFPPPMAQCLVPPLSGILGGPIKKPRESKPKEFQEKKWNLRYKELLEYVKEKGHANVPHTYPENQRLACWVKRQRRLHKQLVKGEPTAMTEERLKLLTETGFIFDSHEINWREKLDALEEYCKKEGHCNVPSNYKDKQLAIWVKCQRRQYKLFWEGKTTAMNPERIRELEKKGFEWEVRTNLCKKLNPFPVPFQNPFGMNLQPGMQPNINPNMQPSTMSYPNVNPGMQHSTISYPVSNFSIPEEDQSNINPFD